MILSSLNTIYCFEEAQRIALVRLAVGLTPQLLDELENTNGSLLRHAPVVEDASALLVVSTHYKNAATQLALDFPGKPSHEPTVGDICVEVAGEDAKLLGTLRVRFVQHTPAILIAYHRKRSS